MSLSKPGQPFGERETYEGDPFCPAPRVKDMRLCDPSTHDRPKCSSSKAEETEQREDVCLFHWCEHVGYASTNANRRCRPYKAGQKAKDDLATDVGSQSGSHDEDTEQSKCRDVDLISAEHFGEGASDEAPGTESEQKTANGAETLGNLTDTEVFCRLRHHCAVQGRSD